MKNCSYLSTLACLTIALLLTGALKTQAQSQTECDTIYLTNGRVIAAEIQKTGKDDVSYHYCGDPAKKIQTLKIKELHKIKYWDKEEKTFGETSENSQQKWHLETTDGNDFIGYLIVEDADKIIFNSETVGEITVRRSKLKSLSPVAATEIVNGEYWFRNPHDTRYYFGPNGYGIRKGEAYYQNTWIFYNQLSYGFTDNISVGVGMVPLFLFGAGVSPVWITPKVSIPVVKDKFNVGVGAFAGTILGESGTGFGIVYGVATFGPRNKNLSIGLGYGYADGDFASQPAISLSYMSRFGKKFAFITENYSIKTFDERLTLISAGIRFLGKKLAIDAALFAPLVSGQEIFIALPWLGITVPFGKKQGDIRK